MGDDMQVIYSGTKNGKEFGFYLAEKGDIPKELQKVRELTLAEHGALTLSCPEGKRLTWNEKTGEPFLEDIPKPTAEEIAQETKEKRRQEIVIALQAIDTKTIRPQRSISVGTANSEDRIKLKELEIEASKLRSELQALG